MKKLSIAILGAMLLPMSNIYAETKPTVEGAHGFIGEVLRAGGTKVRSGWVPISANLKNQLNYRMHNPKTTSVSGGECTTKISISYIESYRRYGEPNTEFRSSNSVTLLWRDISNVKKDGERVELDGAVRWTSGETYSGIGFYADSPEMAERLVNAMNFLREQCDTKKSQYGF